MYIYVNLLEGIWHSPWHLIGMAWQVLQELSPADVPALRGGILAELGKKHLR